MYALRVVFYPEIRANTHLRRLLARRGGYFPDITPHLASAAATYMHSTLSTAEASSIGMALRADLATTS